MPGDLRTGAGTGDLYRRGFSGGRVDVSGGLPADRLWDRVLEKEVERNADRGMEGAEAAAGAAAQYFRDEGINGGRHS